MSDASETRSNDNDPSSVYAVLNSEGHTIALHRTAKGAETSVESLAGATQVIIMTLEG